MSAAFSCLMGFPLALPGLNYANSSHAQAHQHSPKSEEAKVRGRHTH